MALPSLPSPAALVADVRALFAERSRHQLIAAGLAVLMPTAIIIGFYFDSRDIGRPQEQIVYAESWPADRSDDVIKAEQKVDQVRRRAIQAERQRQFQVLKRRLGF